MKVIVLGLAPPTCAPDACGVARLAKAGRLLLLLGITGCAGSLDGADPEYRRLDANVRAIEEFERRKAQCTRSGGIMSVGRSTRARQPPTARELRRVICQRHGIGTFY